jgi:hypothetical protein
VNILDKLDSSSDGVSEISEDMMSNIDDEDVSEELSLEDDDKINEYYERPIDYPSKINLLDRIE